MRSAERNKTRPAENRLRRALKITLHFTRLHAYTPRSTHSTHSTHSSLSYLTTFTVNAIDFPSVRTVIVVEPAFFAVTSPSADTAAIVADFEVYVTAGLVASGGDITGFS